MLAPLCPLLLDVMFLWEVSSVTAVTVLVEEVEAGGPVSWNAALLSEE